MSKREALRAMNGERDRYRGVFVRFGKKRAFRGPDLTTILLQNVSSCATGKVVTDHLWFNETEGFKALYPLNPGDTLEFRARVKAYEKGYKGNRWDVAIESPITRDYKLSHPTKIIKVSTDT